ncbi:MAG TPA: BON domain-containing protein [Polyangiaceae bacterium]|nr:BON domain-containing protein [Polyangiaceae bacterium]
MVLPHSKLLSVALLTAFASGACDRHRLPANPPLANQPGSPVNASPPVLADVDIQRAVETSLLRDPGVDSSGIHVASTDGIVALTGKANNLLTKRRAVRIAESVKGVRAVSDRIELDLKEQPDKQLTQEIQDALLFNTVTESDKIGVKAEQGIVDLTGQVQSDQDRKMAERIAEGVSGVRAVKNDVLVDYSAQRTDPEIAADVQSRLRWDALLNDGLIDVRVKDGKVTLGGAVASAAERRRASSDAWVVGVKGVDTEALAVSWWAKQNDLKKNKLLGVSDPDIRSAILSAVAYDPRVRSAGVQVTVDHGIADLRGNVGSPNAKMAAEDLARDTVGVVSVKNELTVQPVKQPPDAMIQTRLQAAILWDPYMRNYSITSQARDGKVTLTGTVASAFERAQATNVAAGISGVKEVDNELKVQRDEISYVYDPYLYPYSPYWQTWYYAPLRTGRTDAQIAGDIRDELHWSPFVDESGVRVNVVDGKATLTGQVGTQAERAAATTDAIESGALVVDNRLKVTSSI